MKEEIREPNSGRTWYNKTGGPQRKQCAAAGPGYPKESTWNWVFRPLGYEIDSDSDGAEKPHHGARAWSHPHKDYQPLRSQAKRGRERRDAQAAVDALKNNWLSSGRACNRVVAYRNVRCSNPLWWCAQRDTKEACRAYYSNHGL